MSYRSGPTAARLFTLLLDGAMPRNRCRHLQADPGSLPKLLTSWGSDRLECPSCAGTGRDRALADGAPCPGCGEQAATWMTHSKRAGAIALVVAMCPDCARRDENDRASQERVDAAAGDHAELRDVGHQMRVPNPRTSATSPIWSD